MKLKGLTEPVPVHQPLGRSAATSVAIEPVGEVVGREEELETLRPWIEQPAGLVLIEGKAGIGKSALAGEVLREVDGLVLVGGADPTNQNTSGHAWRGMLATCLGSEPLERARELLAGRPELLPWLPLLEDLLPVGATATPLTSEMEGQGRAEARDQLVVELLRQEAPAVIFLEDAQWFDSASWGLLLAVRRTMPDQAVLLTTRPLGDTPPDAFREIHERSTEYLVLTSLSDEAIAALAAHTLGARVLSDEVEAFLVGRAEGHALFAEELALALRGSGVVTLDGETAVARSADVLNDLGLPETVEGVIGSRIDQLSAEEQMAVKVASVVGRVFALTTLRGVHPIEEQRALVGDHAAASSSTN